MYRKLKDLQEKAFEEYHKHETIESIYKRLCKESKMLDLPVFVVERCERYKDISNYTKILKKNIKECRTELDYHCFSSFKSALKYALKDVNADIKELEDKLAFCKKNKEIIESLKEIKNA